MQYKVIHYFEDLQDFNHPYHAGDSFPRIGFSVSEARIAELSSANNRQGKPLIERVDDFAKHMTPPEEKTEVRYTKTEINRMSTAELKELAQSEEIPDAENLTGGELKKRLIERYGL